MMSAKISPTNSLVGLKGISDPTNRSVIEGDFNENDSMHKMNHRRHKSKQLKQSDIQKPLILQHDPELDEISSIHLNQM